ncbi:L-serine ammonia-lyase, iron-sulfur-dependent, subunit alpha (plasmid) [Arsenophonus sp. aPb]|uniref:L-cysteine desulfidase family protein n=1 Tax=Arsenophonus sp. aPb TaxID=3041619 RepID=UPI002468752C|nr:L-serine ammonia-lyase, iron-sulfur-dependent, subunit alpha [Arsenophonus sp. aPb]WGL99789.1 L-serine ammonia-lyase, iron-sulfur-dependent, subunit alpha [Arsenophonus sp. aPb]
MGKVYDSLFIQWLKQEITPALGCTEPVAIAFAAATIRKYLKEPCLKIFGFISENLYKNAIGVTIPGTNYSGIEMAAAVGIFGGDPDKGLEALQGLTGSQIKEAHDMVNIGAIKITTRNTPDFIHIDLTAIGAKNCCRIVIKTSHTCITELYVNGQPIKIGMQAGEETSSEELPGFSIQEAFHFVNQVPFENIKFILKSAQLNSVLSETGRKKSYGLNINGILMSAINNGLMSDDLLSRIVIETVAASDARMGGAPIAAMSNFGSGNQGIVATMPVVVLARDLNACRNELARALALSHLTSISIHNRYNRLSALCAASTAAMGAAAGMAWLFTHNLNVIHTSIINMISDISGIICDGASNSCAMKVSTVTTSAFKAVLMAKENIQVSGNDGIVDTDVEQSINNLCRLVVNVMPSTDKEIIHIMAEKNMH